ncbi:MAG: hypothetical protein HGB05_12925 [Chloroflexi bacterium]|nr:hypothetical protein [Chloroflexota bacterium]
MALFIDPTLHLAKGLAIVFDQGGNIFCHAFAGLNFSIRYDLIKTPHDSH